MILIKIALVSDVIYPYVKGGAEKRTYSIAISLRDMGHEVHLVGVRWWEGEQDFMKDGIHYHGVCKISHLYHKDGRRSISEALKFTYHLGIHLLKNDYDIIDSNEFPYIHNLVVKMYCTFKRKPMVITWHEVWDCYWREYLGSAKGMMGRWIEKASSHLPDHIIANSDNTRSDLMEKLKIKSEKITVSRPTISIDVSGASLSKDVFDVLFCGRLIKEKNVDLLIRSVRNLGGNVTCGIIGDGPEKQNLVSLVNEYGLGKNIKFLGFLGSHDEVISYMKSAKLFVFPSEREGFGIALLEASACGLPSIVIDNEKNAAKELVRNGVSGYVCAPDEGAIAEKIALILGDEKLRRKLSRNSKSMASSYIGSKSFSKIEGIYKRLIMSRTGKKR